MRLVLVVGARGSGKSHLLRQLAEQQANLGNPSNLGVVLRGQTAQSQDWPETIPLAHLSDGACVCCDSDALTRAVRAVERRGCDVVALETDNFSEPDHLLSASRGLADAVSFACVVEPGAFQAAWTSNERQPYGEKRHVVDVLVEQIEQTHRVSLNRFGAEDSWLEDLCRALHPAVDIVDGADGVLLEPATQPEKPFEGVGRKRKKPRADRAVDCWTYEQQARPFHPHRLVDTVVRKLPVSRPGETLEHYGRGHRRPGETLEEYGQRCVRVLQGSEASRAAAPFGAEPRANNRASSEHLPSMPAVWLLLLLH